MAGFGKILVLFGGILVIAGVLLLLSGRMPFLGKLPGDIHIKKENFELYVPLATSVVLSLIVSGILLLVSYFTKSGEK